jgi:hypothetical protein
MRLERQMAFYPRGCDFCLLARGDPGGEIPAYSHKYDYLLYVVIKRDIACSIQDNTFEIRSIFCLTEKFNGFLPRTDQRVDVAFHRAAHRQHQSGRHLHGTLTGREHIGN